MTNIEKQSIEEITKSESFLKIAESKNLSSKDIFKILKKASYSFRFSLTKDEMITCSINALWKAVERYSNDSNCKFTTYLYKGVVMECLTQKKFNSEKSSKGVKTYANSSSVFSLIEDSKNTFEPIDMLDEINFACEDPSLILDRLYKNLSIKEIAKDRGVCGESIRIKIKKNLKNLKHALEKSV